MPGNQIKHLYLVDAYIDLAKSKNPLMPYLVARTMFEFSAFLHEVRTRLIRAASLADQNWQQAGEKFHGEIVRARFATGKRDLKDLLLASGVPEKRLEPLNVTNCIQGLASIIRPTTERAVRASA